MSKRTTRIRIHVRTTPVDFQATWHPDRVIGKIDQMIAMLEQQADSLREARSYVNDWWEKEGPDLPFATFGPEYTIEVEDI